MTVQVILEGLGLGILLILVCAIGIRKGAVGMVHLYSPEVQDRCVKLGLTTHEKIKRNALIFKAVCGPGYIGYVLVCVYGINGTHGFAAGMDTPEYSSCWLSLRQKLLGFAPKATLVVFALIFCFIFLLYIFV